MSPKTRIRKVLVANRGEIAVRVMRTCREMGLATVAVYSDADRGALHVRKADEAVHVGPSPARDSYLVIEKLIDAAKKSGADALHPGYGFLSENAELARACAAAGLTFVGPPPEAMDAMGVKTVARRHMNAAGVPTVPGSEGPIADEQEAKAFADALGYPVMIKAAAGGGGKGMRKVEREADFLSLWDSARRESAGAFGDERLYLEKFLDEPRHVEIQIFADEHGDAIHLGERECSVQRRQQKVVEESPSCVLDERMRQAMGEVAVRAARAVGYRGAGTVEFLVDAHRSFYFLEMNTRLQVEHPVTEVITGLDLVRMQLEVAQGGRVGPQDAVVRRGHAIEARIYAEDPARRFMPSPGKITYLRVPGGPGIRDDSGVYPGWVVPQYYDPLLSKLVAWAPTRDQAIERLIRALGEYTIHGITTNVAYLAAVLDHPAFRAGAYDTGFCARYEADLVRPPDPAFEDVALIAAAVEAYKRDRDAAEASAARAGAVAASRSNWARLGRARALRGGGT
ncbi:acetyl-CoA carboxylase biotin carboxylase subunit [Anaeromyxobacter terrae]|uniref:acetyl-CoA carboxylase biotin carboxylase subunit n=1 Tax=Anaeromyxobacter terrae TaxID=2925406 RepID=UPI001F59E381|nr:acetyl-CoA carboxylase biotin carboxylase subunit [Anaeromyxobacter sp. SG22]